MWTSWVIWHSRGGTFWGFVRAMWGDYRWRKARDERYRREGRFE